MTELGHVSYYFEVMLVWQGIDIPKQQCNNSQDTLTKFTPILASALE